MTGCCSISGDIEIRPERPEEFRKPRNSCARHFGMCIDPGARNTSYCIV